MRALVMPPVTRDARPDVQQGKAGRAGHAGCAWRTGRTGRASLRGAAAAALLLAVLPASATAQARTVVVQEGESAFEVQVDRLVQELLQKRRATLALASNLRAMQVALRNGSVGEEQRTPVQTSMRLVREHLASLESDMAGIQQRLRVMCAPNERPEGWVGIAYSGSATATREDDGRLIMRFVDYPSIESVEPGSPADKAGIRGGDRILAMSGKDLRDAEIDFTPLLKPGTRIPFKVRRGVESKLLTVTVEPRPDDFATPCPWVDERISAALAPMRLTVTVTADDDEDAGAPSPESKAAPRLAPRPSRVFVKRPSPPAPPGAVSATAPVPPLPPVAPQGSASTVVFGGAQFVAVGRELAEALGVERGLLVVGAGRGSPAEQSGLRPGDVVIAVEGRSIASPLVFLQAVEQSEGRELRLRLMRRGKPAAITLRW